MAMEHLPYETLEGHSFPTVRQISVFMENRVGQLLRLSRLMEENGVRILSLSVLDSVDCAIVRLLTGDPDRAIDLLRDTGFAISVAEMVVVRVPHGPGGLLTVWSALLSSEINIAYAYPLLSGDLGPTLALKVDNIEIAVDTLFSKKFEVLSESDLHRGI